MYVYICGWITRASISVLWPWKIWPAYLAEWSPHLPYSWTSKWKWPCNIHFGKRFLFTYVIFMVCLSTFLQHRSWIADFAFRYYHKYSIIFGCAYGAMVNNLCDDYYSYVDEIPFGCCNFLQAIDRWLFAWELRLFHCTHTFVLRFHFIHTQRGIFFPIHPHHSCSHSLDAKFYSSNEKDEQIEWDRILTQSREEDDENGRQKNERTRENDY